MAFNGCGRLRALPDGLQIGMTIVPNEDARGLWYMTDVVREALRALDPPLTAMELIWLYDRELSMRGYEGMFLRNIAEVLQEQQVYGASPPPTKRRRKGQSGAAKREQLQ